MNAVTIQVQQQTVNTDTKTHDNVTVTVQSAIQFTVDPAKVDDYYFKLSNPWQQMAAHVENIVRGHIPKMELDEVYAAKTKLADEIKSDLSKSMSQYGVNIHSCLMTDIIPDSNVLLAMNEINAAKRNREANIQKAEADKLTAVKLAESKAESRLLAADADGKAMIRKAEGEASATLMRAEGNAQAAIRLATAEAEVQRLAGVSIAQMREASGLDGRQVAHLTIATQYLEALAEFGRNGKGSIVVPHSASAVADVESQVAAPAGERVVLSTRWVSPTSGSLPPRQQGSHTAGPLRPTAPERRHGVVASAWPAGPPLPRR
jgi:regulator of protease activity HflC (stomatin/prohibitin superfamily)